MCVCVCVDESAVDQEGSLVSSQVSVDEEKAETGEGSKVENPQPRPSTKKPSMVPLPDGGNGAIQVDCGASHTGAHYISLVFVYK